MSELLKLNNFINGQYQPPVKGKYINNYSPRDGKVYSLVADSTSEDIDLAVKAAKDAFPGWSNLTITQRSAILVKVAEGIEKRLQEFAEAESRDQGKPVQLAANLDIPRSAYNFRYYAGHILYHTEQSMTSVSEPKVLSITQRTPLGVAGLISPWNLPLYLLTWKIAPAIAVGNTCVCKPSEMSSMTAYLLGQVLNDAGVPPGVVNIVLGTGPNAGSHLIQHPDISLISFTGGTKTGELISRVAAPLHKKLSLELGGKNPALVFDDCNLEEVLNVSVRSSFNNQGEICLCNSRIYVQSTIYETFVKRFVEKVKSTWKVGDPQLPTTDMGALISTEHLAKIEYYVALAKEEGGVIELGGKRPNDSLPEELRGGYYYEPTIITGLKPESRVMQEEIFGPVVTICPFDTEEQAISYANNINYGLSSSVWTENGKRAIRVASKVQCGVCWVNCWMVRDLRTPFGGVKQSGNGREGGEFSIDFYTEQKTIVLKL